MPFVETEEASIHYASSGSGDTVLVMLHGNTASWRWWRPVMIRLPPGWRAYAPDLRGFGETRRLQGGYSIDSLVCDLNNFAAALGLPAFHIVGHSLGGVAALQFTLDHPEKIRSLTMIAPAPAEGLSPIHGKGRGPRWLRRLSMLPRDVSLKGLDLLHRSRGRGGTGGVAAWPTRRSHVFSQGEPRDPGFPTPSELRPLVRKALASAMPSLPRDDAFEALVRDVERVPPRVIREYARDLDDWRVEAELGRVVAPVLILWGRKDYLIPYAGLKRTADGLQQAQLVTWPDVGHVPHLERPDRFVRLLKQFIEASSSETGAPGTASPAPPGR
jgi:pimeloyl-ACP methyl ester carboxylesterase